MTRQVCQFASNGASESVHAASTDMLVVFDTIWVDYCAVIDQSRFNNDFGRAHKNNASNRKRLQTKKKKKATGANTVGAFHFLSPNARKSLIRFAKEHAKEQKERFGKYLKEQFQTIMDKDENARQKLLDERLERCLDAMFCLHLYHSPRCWRSAVQVRREFAVFGCESERIRILKQQLLIYVLGLGIEKAHHPWSEGGHTFTADELLEWLITTMMPMAKKLDR